MNCTKKEFESLLLGTIRANEINDLNTSNTGRKKIMIAFICDKCKKVHLTSMPQKKYKQRITDNNNRTQKREQRFINRETIYWESFYCLSS